MQPSVSNRRGLGRVEVLAIVLSVAVLFAIVVISLQFAVRGHPQPPHMADATQIKGIHQSLLIFARQNDGLFPTPGLIDRLPIDVGGGLQELPDRGEEDISKNTTASLFSVMVMQNYFDPVQCVGPTEPNPKVTVYGDKGPQYNWNNYNPAAGIYWDPEFAADLKTGSNVSYAHLPLFGERKIKQWRESLDANFALLGNRGPRNGDPAVQSITYDIHPPFDKWTGNICFNDGHVEFMDSMTHNGDNFFADEDGRDMFLTFTARVAAGQPVFQHD